MRGLFWDGWEMFTTFFVVNSHQTFMILHIFMRGNFENIRNWYFSCLRFRISSRGAYGRKQIKHNINNNNYKCFRLGIVSLTLTAILLTISIEYVSYWLNTGSSREVTSARHWSAVASPVASTADTTVSKCRSSGIVAIVRHTYSKSLSAAHTYVQTRI